MTRKRPQTSTTRRLHRSVGAGAALFVIFMVFSGLIINHSNWLGLDQRHVSQSILLNWYGLKEPEHIHSFAVGNDWLSFAGSQLYLNAVPVATISNGLGVVSNADMLIAAGSDELLLLDHTGQLIERQPWNLTETGPIELVGLLPTGIVVMKSGGQVWRADKDLLNWKMTGGRTKPIWSFAEPTPQKIELAITQQYRGEGLSLEKFILDLHSGRIFGPVGTLIYDLLALSIGFLAISGLVIWFRCRSNGNGNRNGKREGPRR